MSDEFPGSGADKPDRDPEDEDKNSEISEVEESPSKSHSPKENASRVHFNQEDNGYNNKSHKMKKDTHKMKKEGARERRPTPYPKNRRVKARVSCEDTMLQPQDQDTNPLLQKPPKKKSSSMDAIVQSTLTTIPSSDSIENNNVGQKGSKSNFSRLFASSKVAPVDVTMNICTTESQPKMEVCIHVAKSDDSMDNICRICHDSPSAEKLIKPCLCKGSMGRVHRTCLERWLGESAKGACEICGQEFNTVRVPRFRGFRSVIAWIRNPLNRADTRNLFFDFACFCILTPLACLSSWLCVVGAENYATERHKAANHQLILKGNETLEMRAQRDASNSTWTSVGLLSLTGTLVAAYYIWLFVAFRYHLQVWKEWQQRNYVVTIVPMANGEYCHAPVAPSAPRRSIRSGRNSPQQGQDQNGNGRQRESEVPSQSSCPNGTPNCSNQIQTLHSNANISQSRLFGAAIEQSFLTRSIESTCMLNAEDSDMAIIQQALIESFETSQPRVIIHPGSSLDATDCVADGQTAECNVNGNENENGVNNDEVQFITE